MPNSRASTVVLRAPDGTERRFGYTVEEIAEGYSLETIDLDAPEGPANRARSLALDGTPGRPNSRRIPEVDLALVSAAATPDTIRPPGIATIRMLVENAGRTETPRAEAVVFLDTDGDTARDAGETVLGRSDIPMLRRGERSERTIDVTVGGPFSVPIAASVVLADDEVSRDDAKRVRLVVGIPAGGLRITEIMVDPAPGEGRWIEIANVGDDPLPLAGCAVAGPRSAAPISAPAPHPRSGATTSSSPRRQTAYTTDMVPTCRFPASRLHFRR